MTTFSGKMNHGGKQRFSRVAYYNMVELPVLQERKAMNTFLHEEKVVFNSSYELVMEAPELFPIVPSYFDADL